MPSISRTSCYGWRCNEVPGAATPWTGSVSDWTRAGGCPLCLSAPLHLPPLVQSPACRSQATVRPRHHEPAQSARRPLSIGPLRPRSPVLGTHTTGPFISGHQGEIYDKTFEQMITHMYIRLSHVMMSNHNTHLCSFSSSVVKQTRAQWPSS